MKTNIICSGNISFDFIYQNKKSTKSLTFNAIPGGSVLNTAIHLSRLGLPTYMISKTGTDFLGKLLLDFLKKEKLNTDYIIQDKELKTGLSMAKLNKKGDSSYLFYTPPGEQTSIQRKQLKKNIFKNAAVFHTASAFSYNDFTFESTLYLMKEAREENVFITYDPNWREGRIKNKKKVRTRIKQLLEFTDLLKLSDTDAIGITGSKTLSGALKKLPINTIVTLGDKGSFFMNGKKKSTHPAFTIPISDTIGAGDAFTAGLIYSYCKNGRDSFYKDLNSALLFSSALSALICKEKGATTGIRNLNQVKTFISKKKSSLIL